MGGAPPPRTGCAAGQYPTLSHSATQLASLVPPWRHRGSSPGSFSLQLSEFRGGSAGWSPAPSGRQDGVANDSLHAGLQFAGPVRSIPSDASNLACWPSPALLFLLVLAACGGGGGAAGAEPASAVPAGTAIYFEGVVRPEGDQRDDVLDAARKVLRTDDPEAQAARADRQGPRGLRPQERHVQERHRAVAGREGRRLGRRRRPEEAGLRRGRRGQGHRGGAGGDRQGRQVRRRQGQGALLLRRRLPGGRGRRGGRDRRRLLHGRHRGRVQAHDQGAGRRLARRVEEVQGDDRRARRRPDRAVLRRPQAVHRAVAQVRPEGRGAARAGPLDLPDRQARPDRRRAAGRRRPDRLRLDHAAGRASRR